MKKLTLLCFIIIFSIAVNSQSTAITSTGQRIIVFPNGTWINADSSSYYGSQGIFNADIKNEFISAYNFAFNELYSDVFFESERKQKAADWAGTGIRNGLTIYAGSKSLTSWYDDLYHIAFNYIFSGVFFESERQKQSIEWVRKILETRTVFDPYYYNSYFKKYKEAYSLAYDKIYSNEFFASDRKTKSRNWTNTFMTGK
jgi:hypothetical protein